jgi:class 3 adenylate cyclase
VGGARCPARPVSPEAYTPKHLAERIINSKAALEGGRKQVTVLFADLKGSMELLADRDPEEARRILDPGHTTRSLDELAAALAGAAYHISAALKERDPRRGGREQRCILEDPGQGEEPT